MQDELQRRVSDIFGHLVVNKKAALLSGLDRTPRFVTEYLIASARQKNAAIDLLDVRERIRRYAIDADRKNEFISKLMREGTGTLITLLDVEPVPERNAHLARIPQLDGHVLSIPETIVTTHPELLYGGMWGSVGLRYHTEGSGKPTMAVETFVPYQLARPDTGAFVRGRARFSFDEWVDLMITSAGYAPDIFTTLRHKLLMLSRLVPLAENNVNLVELGPRNTGKSYLLRNLSARVYLSSGARATPASFFYDLNRRRLGVIGVKKVVVFDEITATAIADPSFVAALLDYMQSGGISRGGRQMTSTCSLVFTGNIELGPDGQAPRANYPHLFHVFPSELAKSAFVDRVHGFLPGWELPKITDTHLSGGVGFLSDYFGEVLTELRRDPSFADRVRDKLQGLVSTGGALTLRDKLAVERLLNGLTRILFPDGHLEDGPFEALVQVALELRLRVHKQLTRMSPGEFKDKEFSYQGRGSPPLTEELGHTLGELDQQANQHPAVGMLTTLVMHDDSGGGDRGFVQCGHVSGKGLNITGIRGPLLDRAIKSAYDTLLNVGHELGLPAATLSSQKMLVHLVNLAAIREGGSSGLAFALAMFSAVTGRPLRSGLATTANLTLHGNLVAVGGLAERLVAAIRHGRTQVLVPEANREDVRAVPELLEKIEIVPVRTLAEAVAHAMA